MRTLALRSTLALASLAAQLDAQAELHSLKGTEANAQVGHAVAALGDIDGDGVPDYAYGAPGASSAIGTGRVTLMSGSTHSELGVVEGLGFLKLGYSMAGLGDADLDGVPDLIVGAPGGPGTGWATLVSGALLTETLSWPGLGNGDEFGTSVAGAGDMDGDGGMDFVVGAPQGTFVAQGDGYARAYSGASGGLLFHWSASAGEVSFGRKVGQAGDWNSDGTPDIAVAQGFSDASVRVYSGANGGLLRELEEGASLSAQPNFGEGMCAPGDLNGDGRPELVLSARTTALFGPPHSEVRVYSAPFGNQTQVWEPGLQFAHYGFGRTIVTPGDWDGDGVNDVVIASPDETLGGGQLQAHLSLRSGATGASLGGSLLSTGENDRFGFALAALGDLDGDGASELLVGAPDDSTQVFEGGALSVVSRAFDGPLRVPLDHATIQDAVNVAPAGAEILVSPGLYEEALDFGGKALRVAAAQGPESVVLRPPVGVPGVRFANGEGADSVLEGFVLVDGNAPEGGAVFCLGSSPTLRSCTFLRNRSGVGGGALGCGLASPRLEDCRFEANLAPLGAGAALFLSSPQFVDCEFFSNQASGLGGAVWSDAGSSPSFERCSFSGNVAAQGSAALHLEGSASLTSCILWGDVPAEFAGAGTPLVSYSDVQGGVPGASNLNVDPLYYDAANGTLFLRPESPCVDAGNPLSPLDPDGSPADMGAVQGRVWLVPDDAPTLQEAVDGAESGDIVYLRAGTHSGRAHTGGKLLSLCGADRESTVIDLAGTSAGAFSLSTAILIHRPHPPSLVSKDVYEHVADLRAVLLQGFTLTRSDGLGTPGLRLTQGRFALRDLKVHGMRAEFYPALFLGAGFGEIEGCAFRDNRAHQSFGVGTSQMELEVVDSFFVNNHSQGKVGALELLAPARFRRCLFAANSAVGATGVMDVLLGEEALFEQCTFVQSTSGTGAAIKVQGGVALALRSCILWDHAPALLDECACVLAPTEFDHCDVQGGAPAGMGNIDLDPQFLAPALGDYRLSASSPCIDTGSTLSPLDADGSIADQGAFPFAAPGAPSISKIAPASLPSLAQQPVVVEISGSELHLAPALTIDGVPVVPEIEYDAFSAVSTLHFPMPPVSKLGPVDVVVTTPWGAAAASIQVDAPAAPLLVLDEPAWPAASGVAVRVAAQPGDLVFFALSPDLAPTLVPGVLSADIGSSFSSLVVFASATLDASGVATAQADTSAFAPGTTLHFQAALLEAASGGFPLATTNVESGDAQ